MRSPVSEDIPTEYVVVDKAGDVHGLVDRIRKAGAVSVDTETTSQEATRAELVGISLSVKAGEAFYLPLAHRRTGELALDDAGAGAPNNLPPLSSAEMRPLLEMLEDPSVEKTGQNLKYDLIVLENGRGVGPGGGLRYHGGLIRARSESAPTQSGCTLRHPPGPQDDLVRRGGRKGEEPDFLCRSPAGPSRGIRV